MSRSTFVDFRAIKAGVSIEKLLKHYNVFDSLHGSGDTRRGACPIHGGSNKNQFSVNLAKNIWNCFSDCKGGGNVLDFVARREGVDIHRAALLLCEWFQLPASDGSSGTRRESPPHRIIAKAKHSGAPHAENASSEPNKPLGFELKELQPAHPYLAQRGISPELASEFGIGYFPGSKGLMVGRIVIPIHNREGQLVAYAGRFPGESPDENTPKYKLPPGFRKGLELFNLHRVLGHPDEQPFVIVEGFFGCVHLWQHGARRVVALMGAHLSSEQEARILQFTSERTRIVVILDENEAGRTGRADLTLRLALHRCVRIQQLGESQQPTDLTPEQIAQLLKQA